MSVTVEAVSSALALGGLSPDQFRIRAAGFGGVYVRAANHDGTGTSVDLVKQAVGVLTAAGFRPATTDIGASLYVKGRSIETPATDAREG